MFLKLKTLLVKFFCFNGDLNIKLLFSDVLVNEKTKKGPWIFEFKTNGDELALDTDYDIEIRGHDDLNNKIEFYAGRETASTGLFRLSTIHENLDKNATKLYLTPYAVKFPEQSDKLCNDFKKVGDEFTVNLSK